MFILAHIYLTFYLSQNIKHSFQALDHQESLSFLSKTYSLILNL